MVERVERLDTNFPPAPETTSPLLDPAEQAELDAFMADLKTDSKIYRQKSVDGIFEYAQKIEAGVARFGFTTFVQAAETDPDIGLKKDGISRWLKIAKNKKLQSLANSRLLPPCYSTIAEIGYLKDYEIDKGVAELKIWPGMLFRDVAALKFSSGTNDEQPIIKSGGPNSKADFKAAVAAAIKILEPKAALLDPKDVKWAVGFLSSEIQPIWPAIPDQSSE